MISGFTTEIMNPMQRQAASIDSGSGDDFITVEVGLLENVIDAGDGNDVVSITNYGLPDATVTVDLGAGDDKLSVNPHFGSMTITTGDGQDVDLSRFRAAPSARLSHLPFESDRAFPAQC